jgi:hypothetical protein
MNIGTYLYLIILFVVFSPGIVFSIPSSNSSSNSKWIRVFTHGFLFSVVWLFTHKTVYNSMKEGLEEGTYVVDPNTTTPYKGPPPPPPPPLPTINLIRIVAKQNEPDNNYLSLAEVQVWDQSGKNVALGKTPTQSSTWAGIASASRAVDGNTSGNWGDSSTTHTYNGKDQYWELNLGEKYTIKEIKIFNRRDCCQKRLEGATLLLVNDGVVDKQFTLTAESKQVFKF